MIHIFEQDYGKLPITTFVFSENVDMEQAMKYFTEKYRDTLSRREDTIYIESLKKYLEELNNGLSLENSKDIDKMIINLLTLRGIYWIGAGYYKDGDCILLDTEIINNIVDNNKITYLMEI